MFVTLRPIKLVATCSKKDRGEFAEVEGVARCVARVDYHASKYNTDSHEQRPEEIIQPPELIQVGLEILVEAALLARNGEILFEVQGDEVVVGPVAEINSGGSNFSENIAADSSEPDAVSLFAHFIK